MFSSQGVAVLGIALIAMGEEIGSEMALRTFGHLVSSSAALLVFSVLNLLLSDFISSLKDAKLSLDSGQSLGPPRQTV